MIVGSNIEANMFGSEILQYSFLYIQKKTNIKVENRKKNPKINEKPFQVLVVAMKLYIGKNCYYNYTAK